MCGNGRKEVDSSGVVEATERELSYFIYVITLILSFLILCDRQGAVDMEFPPPPERFGPVEA